MDRRTFIKNIGMITGAGTVSFSLGNTPLKAFSRSFLKVGNTQGKVIVLVQLSGGNDGLNTIIPYENSIYFNKRPNIGIRKNNALQLSYDTGMHSSLQPLMKFFNEGKLAVVQSVGYPQPNRSHFRSTDIWLTASDSNKYVADGWIGRFLGNAFPTYPEYNFDHPMAIQIGASQSTLLECTCQGGSMGLSFEDPNKFYQLILGSQADNDPPPNTLAGEQLKFIKQIASQSIKFAESIKESADKAQNSSNYPNTGLARQLSIVARLIGGGLETPVYLTSMGGFDTHSNQSGTHSNLLSNLGESLAAFQEDIEQMGVADKVVIMTFSEFGRTLEQNGSAGTDHGAAAPVLVLGKNVNGGIFGNSPDMEDLDNSGDIKHQFDFRQIYATMLRDHLQADSEIISSDILFKEFEPLKLVSVKNAASGGPLSFRLDQNYPNPFNPATNIRYYLRLPQYISLKIYDVSGGEVAVLESGFKEAGTHTVSFSGSNLPSGHYFAHLVSGSYRKTIKMTLIK